MPLVSVVMPVYNTEKYLAEAIESILAQTFSDFEFIIVDDASQDGSAEIARGFAKRDSRVRLLQHGENMGAAAARNTGLYAAKGEFFAAHDSDDISAPERFQKQVRLLQSQPEVGAVSVHARVVTEDLQPIYQREPPAAHAVILLDHFLGFLSAPFHHSALMMRRILMLEAGGYDASMRYHDDCDMMTRLLGKTKFANIADCLYIYRQHASQLTSHHSAARDQGALWVRQGRLERIWSEAPLETVERLARVRPWSKLSWRERRAAKRDIIRLIEDFIAAGWVDARDRPLMIAAMNQRLERVSPRLWQKFCHWRRHRFGGKRGMEARA